MPLDPTQDFFGSEASQLPGTRRGFGTTATQNVAPIVPVPATPGATSGGSLAPPPVPSSSSLFAPTSAATRLTTDTPVGPNQGIRLPGASATPAPVAPPPSVSAGAFVPPPPPPATTVAGAPPSASGTTTSGGLVHGVLAPPTDGNWQQWFANLVQGQPSSYAAINRLAPQLANAGVQVSYNLEGDPSKLIVPYPDGPHYISVVDQNGAWRWMDQGTPAQAAQARASATMAPPIIPTTGAPTSPLDLSSVDAFTDPSTQFLTDFVKQYMSQLLGPVYSDQATAALKAGPMNAIEAGRQQAIQQAKEQLGSFGVAPSSGVVDATIQQINRQFDALRAQSDQQFATGAITRADTNKQQALSLAGLLADLPVQRLQVAEQAAGMGTNPANLFQELMGFANSATSANLTQQQLQQQFGQGLGSIIGSLLSRSSSGGSAATGSFSPTNFLSF